MDVCKDMRLFSGSLSSIFSTNVVKVYSVYIYIYHGQFTHSLLRSIHLVHRCSTINSSSISLILVLTNFRNCAI